MVRRGVEFILLVFFIVSLTGCASARKRQQLEMQGLKNQVTVLEAQVVTKDEEVNALKEALSQAQVARGRAVGEVKSRPSVKDIQMALAAAGFDPGTVDGKIGSKTRQAIKDFQKANNLAQDGRVGKQTWNVLRGYLYNKEK